MSALPPSLSPAIIRQYLGRIAWRRAMKIQQRGNFDEKYPEDPITAFLVTGNQYFDKELLIARKRELFGFQPFKSISNGAAKLFFQRVPNRRYIIGADAASGREVGSDTDYCAAVVIDLETGEEYASYRAKVTPEDFAYDLADLGRYYNNAVIAPERNMDGGTVILVLKGECGYGNIYMHKDWHKRERKKIIEFEGFPTTQKTRPVALNCLNSFINDTPELIWDEIFIKEALTFVRDEKGVPAAAEGAHDDTVACRWIAYFVRKVQLGWLDPLKFQSERYVPASQITAT